MADQPPTPDAPDPTVRYEPVTTTTTAPPPEPMAPAAPAAPLPPPAAPPPAAWQRTGGDTGRTGAIVFGVILVAIGLWFFADQTLGLEMPTLDWGDIWPLLVIGLGAWIVLRSLGRRAG
jgi:hypothetical protein